MKGWSNEEWIRALRSGGDEQQQALDTLRSGILRTLHWYLSERRSTWGLDRERVKQLAEDFTQEALITILEKLPTFRGESRFTTWAYKVALHRALGELRRRWWKEISLEDLQIGGELPSWPLEGVRSPDPERIFQQEEVWRILKGIVEQDLTQRQRTVLIAHIFQGVPLDVVADHLGTDRDNVYKLLHDARKKLKGRLVELGLTQEEILRIFEMR